MHGFIAKASKRSRRVRQSARSQFRNGERVAVMRAMTAARLHRGERIAPPSLAGASAMCGASLPYVAAMEVLLKAEDTQLLNQVFSGGISLTDAANMVRNRAKLISAWRTASPEDRIIAIRAINPEDVLNDVADAATVA
jgi:hypothetical protein